MLGQPGEDSGVACRWPLGHGWRQPVGLARSCSGAPASPPSTLPPVTAMPVPSPHGLCLPSTPLRPLPPDTPLSILSLLPCCPVSPPWALAGSYHGGVRRGTGEAGRCGRRPGRCFRAGPRAGSAARRRGSACGGRGVGWPLALTPGPPGSLRRWGRPRGRSTGSKAQAPSATYFI